MKDLVNEGYEIQKKFTASLKEEDKYINIPKEYLQRLQSALIADLKKNPSAYAVNGIKPYVDDSNTPGATGAVSWSSEKDGFDIYATPFWEEELGIPIDVLDDDGNDVKHFPSKDTYYIVNKLTTDLKKRCSVRET